MKSYYVGAFCTGLSIADASAILKRIKQINGNSKLSLEYIQGRIDYHEKRKAVTGSCYACWDEYDKRRDALVFTT